jgi:hypothetical protein
MGDALGSKKYMWIGMRRTAAKQSLRPLRFTYIVEVQNIYIVGVPAKARLKLIHISLL